MQTTDNILKSSQSADEIKDIFKLDWKVVPTYDDLSVDFNSTTGKHNEQEILVNKWKEAIDALPLSDSEVISQQHSKYIPKMVKKALEGRCDNLSEAFNRLPNLFLAEGQGLNDEELASQEVSILNQQLKVNRVALTNNFVKRTATEGTSILRINWEYEQRADNVVDTNDEGEELAYEQISIIKNEPVIEVISTKDMYIAPNCTDSLENADFVIEKITTDLYSLYSSGKYTNLEELKKVLVSLSQDTARNTESALSSLDNATDSREDRINVRDPISIYEYWGYWDTQGDFTREHIIATWCEGVLIRLEKNPYPNNLLPFTKVSYSEELDSIYGKADAETLVSNQDVAGAIYRGILNTMSKGSSGQAGIPTGIFPNSVEKQNFNEGKNFQYNPGVSLDRALYVSKFPEISQSSLLLLESQKAELQEYLGTPPIDTRPSAAGALPLMGKKEIGVLRRLSAGFLDIGRKVIAINSVMLSPQDKAEILGREPIEVPLDYNQILKDISLEIATTESINSKISKFSFLLQTLGQSLPFELSQKILASIVELSDEPNLAAELRNYQAPEPSPQEAAAQDLDNRLKEGQLAQIQSGIDNTASDSQLKQAQTRKIDSDGINKDADTNLKDQQLIREAKQDNKRDSDELEVEQRRLERQNRTPEDTALKGIDKQIEKASKGDT